MRITRIPVFLVSGLLAGIQPAEAQRITSPYRFQETSQEIGGYAGYVSSEKGSVGLGAKSGVAYGARFAIRLGGPFMVEAEALYFPTSHAVLDTVVVDSAFQEISSADQTIVAATAAMRFNLTGPRTWNGIMPFVLAGVGVAAQTDSDTEEVEKAPTDARFDFGTSLAGVLGAGIGIFPSKHLSIRIDGRNLLWKVKTPAALLRGDFGRTMPQDEWVQNLSASAGVSIHF